MTTSQGIAFAEVEQLITSAAPALLELLGQFLELPEPEAPDAPATVMRLAELRAALNTASAAYDKRQRQDKARQAWQRYLAQPPEVRAPQMELAALLERLYARGVADGAARQALLTIVREGPVVFGIWGGLKRVYKRAEADLDAEVWGALAARFDELATSSRTFDVRRGTLIYLRRRAWRFLRELGRSAPELYPQFAVELLRNYPLQSPPLNEKAFHSELWISNHVYMHHAGKHSGRAFESAPPTNMVKHRAFTDTWKSSPDPLMLLLETCRADPPADFAIQGLRKDFPELLRKVTPAWLGRLTQRPLTSVHEFFVDTLEGSPEFHQGRLREIALHEPVLSLLDSPSNKARTYAITYARTHATDLPTERLASLLSSGQSETRKFAAAQLKGRPAREVGLTILGRLLTFNETNEYARKALEGDFDRAELPDEFLIDLLLGKREQFAWVSKFLKKGPRPAASFWVQVLSDRRVVDDDDDDHEDAVDEALKALGGFKLSQLPGDWLIEALTSERLQDGASEWVSGKNADALPQGLDIEQVRGLVFRADTRPAAFAILQNTKLVSPRTVGLGWLLALARRADPALHEWAHRYLLEHLRPEHFAEGKDDLQRGIEKLFALATGPREPDAIRLFAQGYLLAHHPVLSRSQTKGQVAKPLLTHAAYAEASVWPALSDERPDVRRFAVDITRVELRRWGAHLHVYELAENAAKEVRTICYDALTSAGQPNADPQLALKPEELDAAQIFSMTESRKRTTRDVAMDLIRKHYERIGGPTRLGWLMQSADREVRMFAAALVWERHRPRSIPKEWRPPQGTLQDSGPFEDVEALRKLLRRILSMVPPGRSADPSEPRFRKVSASSAKQNVVAVVRDLAMKDAAFAQVIAPVLREFTSSLAKGEWQACLQALLQLRTVHGDLALEESV